MPNPNQSRRLERLATLAADRNKATQPPPKTPPPISVTEPPQRKSHLAAASMSSSSRKSRPKTEEPEPQKSKPAAKPKTRDFDQAVVDESWAATLTAMGATPSYEAANRVLGIPLPSLSCEILFQATGLPVGRFYQVIGLPGCSKSSFLFEMQRWTMLASGYALTCETENKDIPVQRNAVWLHNPQFTGAPGKQGRSALEYCHSMEGWQEVVTRFCKAFQQANEGKLRELESLAKYVPRTFGPEQRKKLPLWRFPYMIGVDSLMALAPISQIKQQQEDGHAIQDFARAANSLSRFLQAMTHNLRDTSILLVGTNHCKPTTDFNGNPVPRAPGGHSIRFMETLEIEMNRGARIFNPLGGGVNLSMTILKNSMGHGGITIHVPMVWNKYRCEDGTWRQDTYFDWGSATASYLAGLENHKSGKSLWRAVNDIVDIRSAKGKRLWSKQLGIAESDALTYTEFGTLIDTNTELRQTLWHWLGVTEYPRFRPGVSIHDQYDTVDILRDRTLPSIYPPVDLTGFGEITDKILGRAASDDEPASDPYAGQEDNYAS
jgi:hypothetical protein